MAAQTRKRDVSWQQQGGSRLPEPARIFASTIPLLFFWFFIPAVLCAISLWYQSGAQTRALEAQYSNQMVFNFSGKQGEKLGLVVTYPRRLLLDPVGENSVPVSLWLEAMPVSPAQTTIPPMSGSNEPPYAVHLTTDEPGIAFTDEQNRTVPAWVSLSLPNASNRAASFYIRPPISPWWEAPAKVHLFLAVDDQRCQANGCLFRGLEIPVESRLVSELRQFLDRALGTTPVVLVVLIATVGFAIQGWNVTRETLGDWRQEQEEEKRLQEATQAAQAEIESLSQSLKSDLSEGARTYLRLLKKCQGDWREMGLLDSLEKTWREGAPGQLRLFIELCLGQKGLEAKSRFLETYRRVGPSRLYRSLEWSLQNLDEDLQQKTSALILQMKTYSLSKRAREERLYQAVGQHTWHALLQGWPDLSFWRSNQLQMVNRALVPGLQFLDLEMNPFGISRAENDPVLLHGYYPDQSLMCKLEQDGFSVVLGAPGSGKTAACLWLMQRAILTRKALPVYCTSQMPFQLIDIARQIARTLLRYLALNPDGFLERKASGRAAIARFLGQFIGSEPELGLRWQEAGLSPTGAGLALLRESQRLIGEISFQGQLDEAETLAVLSQICPASFQQIRVFLDERSQEPAKQPGDDWTYESLQTDTATYRATTQSLVDLAARLSRVGLTTRVFRCLPVELKPEDVITRDGPPVEILRWEPHQLMRLLETRLHQAGVDSIERWCLPQARALKPDEMLVQAAKGSPARLIEQGNQLLRRIGQRQAYLTSEDLQSILLQT